MPHLSTADGTELFYRDYGTGRPVVFVHSMLMSSDMWQHQMAHLTAHGLRTVAYDRRGHGRSDDPGTGYDFDTLAGDLAALLDRLDLTDVVLVGDELGCHIPRLEKDATIRDWMRVTLRAAVECTRTNLAADLRPELRRITLPALVIHGDHDVFAPLETCGRPSSELLPRSTLTVYSNASHMLHLSHREQLNHDLLSFATAGHPTLSSPCGTA